MKIFFLIPEFNVGGVEHHILDLSKGLTSLGHNITIISNGGSLCSHAEALGIRHLRIPIHRKHPLSLLQVRHLKHLFSQEAPDIVHAHSRMPAWLCWLAWKNLPKNSGTHFVTTVHGANSVNAYSRIMTRGERVIVVSEFLRHYILNHYPKMQAERTRLVYQGVDDRFFHRIPLSRDWLDSWRQTHPRQKGEGLLLLPGRISRGKGHGDFLKVIAELRRRGRAVHGLIAGTTHPRSKSLLRKLRQHAYALGIGEHVSFLGQRDDIRELMLHSDIVYVLSHKKEAFGRGVIEALSLGKPVLGYSHGGVEEQLSKMFPEGRLIPGDISGVVMLTDRFLKEKIAINPIPDCFTITSMCRNTLAVYEELLGRI